MSQKKKDPASLRSQLGRNEYSILDKDEVLRLLQVVNEAHKAKEGAGGGSLEEDESSRLAKTVAEGKQAKDTLILAFLRLIESQIGKLVQEGREIGIEGRSDIFNSIAGQLHAEMSGMADGVLNENVSLSACIICRVARKLYSKFGKPKRIKRSAEFDSSEIVAETSHNDPGGLDALIHDTSLQELQSTLDQLDEQERLVILSTYGLETGQPLHLQKVAEQLRIDEKDAKNASRRGMYKLRKLLGKNE